MLPQVESGEAWLAAMWPFVRDELPGSGLRVLELGCGPMGGFVPMLLQGGHEALGVDPSAPAGARYRRVPFRDYERSEPLDAVIACLSLHHVSDLVAVLDAIAAVLSPGGSVIVIEWASERFDLETAEWCFDRLMTPDADAEPTWLHRHGDDWAASGQPWETFHRRWAHAEGLSPGDEILTELDRRFDVGTCRLGPYFFPDLRGTTMADEQVAIDASEIRATGIQYAGRRR